MEVSTYFDTSHGTLRFRASAKSTRPDEQKLELMVSDLEPQLPIGYEVNWVKSVVLLAWTETEFRELKFECTLESELVGGGECGQFLDASSWKSDSKILMIGTEDADGIIYRAPNYGVPRSRVFLGDCRPHGKTIELYDVPKVEFVSLHFVIAENDFPEKKDCSTWYAVDVPHERLLNQIS